MKKPYWMLVSLVVLVLLAGCSGLPAANSQGSPSSTSSVIPLVRDGSDVIAEGNIAPRDWVRLTTRAGGEVAEVLVKEGDQVAADAVLLRFKDSDGRQAALTAAQLEEANAKQALDDLNKTAELVTAQSQAAVRSAEKALIDAQQALDDLDSRQYSTDLDNARKDVNTYEQDLEDAQKEFDKYKDLDPSNADRKRTKDLLDDAQKKYDDAMRKRDLLVNELDQANTAVTLAKAQLADAVRLEDLRRNGPDTNQLALLQARVTNAEAQVTAAEQAIADLEVRAPYASTVVTLDVKPGETILPNQQVVLLADFSAWYVETDDLTEIEVVKVAEGQPARIVPDALPDASLAATVESIARDSSKKGGDVTYTVRLALDESDPALRWGMTVEVRISPK